MCFFGGRIPIPHCYTIDKVRILGGAASREATGAGEGRGGRGGERELAAMATSSRTFNDVENEQRASPKRAGPCLSPCSPQLCREYGVACVCVYMRVCVCGGGDGEGGGGGRWQKDLYRPGNLKRLARLRVPCRATDTGISSSVCGRCRPPLPPPAPPRPARPAPGVGQSLRTYVCYGARDNSSLHLAQYLSCLVLYYLG